MNRWSSDEWGGAREGSFWVAELIDPRTGSPFAPALYWSGHTRPLFEPVTTTSIYEALKFRDAAACQAQIEKLAGCKRGVLVPMEHAWAPVPRLEGDQRKDEEAK